MASQTELELLITAKTNELRGELNKLQGDLDKLASKSEQTSKSLGSGFKNALPDISKFALGVGAAGLALQAAKTGIQGMLDKEQKLAEFSALTGVTGVELTKFGDIAVELSNKFGGTTLENIESFKGVLGRLGPDFASSSEAVAIMGENINVLAKAGGIDATAAMDALTTTMLQFGVDLSDPMKAAQESTRIINAMAAGAKEGAAEVPDLSAAMIQTGSIASAMGISVEGTVAALEGFAIAGKKGAEGGVAFRNFLSGLTSDSKPAIETFKQMGISQEEVARLLKTDVGAAFDYLRGGLSKLGGGFEQATAIANIWGKENAAAITKAVGLGDQMTELQRKVTGTNTAFEQSAIIMETNTERYRRFGVFLENELVKDAERGKESIGELVNAAEKLAALDFSKVGLSVTKLLSDFANFSTFGGLDWITKQITGYESLNDALGLNAEENRAIQKAAFDKAKQDKGFIADQLGMAGAMYDATKAMQQQQDAITQTATTVAKVTKKKGGKSKGILGDLFSVEELEESSLKSTIEAVTRYIKSTGADTLSAAQKAMLISLGGKDENEQKKIANLLGFKEWPRKTFRGCLPSSRSTPLMRCPSPPPSCSYARTRKR